MSPRPHMPSFRSSLALTKKSAARQQGVVLIVSLIMLVVISLLATLSIKNAVSTEGVSGNVRTSQLASQAAEIALRYCEDAVSQISTGTGTLVDLPTIQNYATPPLWQTASNWDSASSVAFVIPSAFVNETSGSATFKRLPECMVERMQVVNAGVVSTTSTYVITARGFGPEVAAADSARSRPEGSESWMQSTIELN